MNLPEEPSSFFALEGTSAHEIAEIEASRAFGYLGTGVYLQRKTAWREAANEAGFDTAEMIRHAKDYVVFLQSLVEEYPNAVVLLEQKLDTGIPGSWGTSDAVIISPEHVGIVDYKYGRGIAVSAKDNSQMMCYGLGALDLADMLGVVRDVTVSIFQPRTGNISSWTQTADELRAWREKVIPIAEDALAGSTRFGPSESACRWCPVSGQCRAQMEFATEQDFSTDPDLLDPEEIGLLLHEIPQIKAWCAAIEKVALQKVYSENTPVPGWKVVRSGGRRVIVDPAAAIQTFIDLGFKAEQVAQFKTRPLGELERLLRPQNKRLEDVLGQLMKQTEGSESLVKESDKRPSVNHNSEAVEDFTD